jgi:predicted  nucleic acid-binding Zn-ribbon protein
MWVTENDWRKPAGGHMSKVYESLKDVVQGALQPSKVNANSLARLKGTTAQSLNDQMEETEKVIADTIARLKADVKEREAIVAEETAHAEQVITSLRANITALEDKVKETEENFRQSELASQRMEESVTSKMQDLQGEIKKREKSLESRGHEVDGLKSKVDTLEREASQLQHALQQANEKADSEGRRVEQVTETFEAKIARLEVQLKKTEETVRRKDSTIKTLEETLTEKIQNLDSQVKNREKLLADRDKQLDDLNSQVQALTQGIKDMSSFFRQAEELAALETPGIGTVLQAEESKNEQDKTATSQSDRPKVMSNQTETAQEIVSPEFFDRLTNELAQIIGPSASTIIRNHVEAIGESIEAFPRMRVTELLETVSAEIPDKNRKTSFRERLGQPPAAIQAPVYEEGSYRKFSIKTKNIDRSIMPKGIYTLVYKNSAFTILEGYDIEIINKLTPLVPALSPHQQWFKFPLQIGQTWNYEDRNEHGRIRENVVTVENPEPIPNSAGMLPSIKLINTGRVNAGGGSSEVVYHYSEKTGCVTKATTTGSDGTVIEVELIEYGKIQSQSAKMIPKLQKITLTGRRAWKQIVSRQTN